MKIPDKQLLKRINKELALSGNLLRVLDPSGESEVSHPSFEIVDVVTGKVRFYFSLDDELHHMLYNLDIPRNAGKWPELILLTKN